MNAMNPYPGYEYVFQMNNPPYPIKIEENFCDFDTERDDLSVPPQTVLPYMSTFSKHATTGIPMFYPQLSYDLHPLIINQRRRSTQNEKYQEIYDPYENSSTFVQPMHFKDSTPRCKTKRVSNKIKIEDQDNNIFGLTETNNNTIQGNCVDSSTKMRKLFHCRSCGKSFKFQTSLLRHNNKVHISKYQCPTCSRVFSRQAYLDVHTSKQGSSCYLEQPPRMTRRNIVLPGLCMAQD